MYNCTLLLGLHTVSSALAVAVGPVGLMEHFNNEASQGPCTPKFPEACWHLIAPENCKVLDLESVVWVVKRSLAVELALFPCWVLLLILSSVLLQHLNVFLLPCLS